ncbi:wax ester/triacylglycerol synthase domain-containing protein [Dermatobacter hominis]|uniref:wax ester/triacylglycerol synthase domain-containing protein n=1 Tax=Dermatobacter hominis TaxID=2884263 RepID=UPI001D110012|nr:wax ester/triacylglycerol synthase domain-containing protein [Dermatobacter hominis]UDY35966.1 WS/DGAT domain-containing protein [Dermatobacter hominis]
MAGGPRPASPEDPVVDRASPEDPVIDRASPEDPVIDRASPEDPVVDRASPEDMVSLASARTSTPLQVGAVLRIDGGADPRAVADALRERIPGIARLRQRLVRTPPGCGRPVWVDDAAFRFERHVRTADLDHDVAVLLGDDGTAGDREAASSEDRLLALAATTVTLPLHEGAPLWRAVIVVEHGRATAVVVAFHHVLTDGIGGLAVLAGLADGSTAPPPAGWPRPAPGPATLAADAWRARWGGLRRLPASARRVAAAARALRPTARPVAPSSLNRPTGPHRRLAVVRRPLEPLHRAAHGRGATVNDAVLVAIAGALRAAMRRRGEDIGSFVVSVPVAGRSRTDASDLGNHVGVVPVAVPATGTLADRLTEVHRRTAAVRGPDRGASAALVGPAFRALGRVGLLGTLMEHQRVVHTFSTDLRGPQEPLRFVGRPIGEVIGIAMAVGNVTVSFTAVSYAGGLALTVVADAEAWPDLPVLASALGAELDALSRADGSGTTPGT